MDINENHILVGLGGTGGKILKAFRKRLYQKYNEEERSRLPIGFVYLDSSMEMMDPDDISWRVLGQNALFKENEFVFIKGVDPAAVLRNPSGYLGLKGFIGNPEVMGKALGEVGAAAAQKRIAGRILFGSSVDRYKKTLEQQFAKVYKISGSVRTNIHIFTGLAGGTGSGSIIDVIAQTRMMDQFRKTLDPDGKSGTNIVVYCMIPEITPPGTSDAGRYHANGYAALTEINGLLTSKYKPYDVSGIYERLDLDAVKNVADGCIVYSNVNEHGKIIESHKQLPAIVSDFAYNRIFLEKNDNTEEFIRAYSFENINDWKFEYFEKFINGKKEIHRAKTFSSFGIKRIVIPEEEIIEYFTYSFGRQALLQLRFNNWNDDLGFRETPSNIDFNSFVTESEQLERWRITDKHLILDKPILSSDAKKWSGIVDYWSSVIPVWTEQASKSSMPLNELEKYCTEGYEKFFRKSGVNNFYDNKTQAKEEHANEITDLIEKYLFDKWSAGDFSLYNLTQLIDKIIESIDQRRKAFEGQVTTLNQTIEQLEQAKALNQLEWANLGLIGGLIRKNKLIQAHSTIMQQLCIKKTEAAGTHFGIVLLASLLNKLNALRGRIERFVNIINESLDESEKQIGARCQDNDSRINLQEAVIRYYDHDGVSKFVKEVTKDKKRQENIASEFRQELIKLIGNEHNFTRANASVSTDTISQMLDTLVRQKTITIHDEILMENHEKIINRNILEQLNEEYRTEDQLRAFAKSVIEQSGVFLTFNDSELKRAITDSDHKLIPPTLGQNILRKIVFINLPNAEGNEQVMKFAQKLKNALVSAVTSGVEVHVDMSGKDKNEITISSISYCFPLRVIESLPFLKEKYDRLVHNSPQARIILHTEGTGEFLPDLFVADEKQPSEIRDEYTAYLILSYVMGIVKYASKEDGTGKSAYGTVSVNRLGEEILEPIADKFTQIPYNMSFTEDFGEDLKEKTEKLLKSDYLHTDKKNALIKDIQALYKEVILPEFDGNKGSEECKFFGKKAEDAMDLIEKV